MTFFDAPEEKPFQNIVGKGENAGNQHFSFFPQCFLSYERQIHYFNPPKRQILDSSKLKDFADDNFNFYENGRKTTNGLKTR